jgi:hypothetical protein
MLSYLRKKFTQKTLKRNVHRYISKQKDICCEENVNRDIAIQHLFDLYSDISGNENTALDEMHEDFMKFVGYKKNDKKNYQGQLVYNQLNKETRSKGVLDKEAMMSALHEVPLYYFLSFLGYAYYRHKEDVVPNSKITPTPSPTSISTNLPLNNNLPPNLSPSLLEPLPKA